MAEETESRAAQIDASATSSEAVLETDSASTMVRDEFDPAGWEVPVICKDCGKDFIAPYRHFKAGVVFHCPHCHGSFIPLLKMYHAVRDAFETFYARRRLDAEEFARAGGDPARFGQRRDVELEDFRKTLTKLAHAMRPAGKMVRRKGIGAMFT